MPTKYVADFEYSDAELLALCNQAIAEIMATGKEYWYAGRKWMAEDLPALRAIRDQLKAAIELASRSTSPELNVRMLRRSRNASDC